MNAQHTPGPWKLSYVGQDRMRPGWEPHEIGPVRIAQHMLGNDLPTIQANARLIAAAPELLEALIECVDAIESSLGLTDYGNMRESDWPELVSARAAIAKAKGGEA